MLSVNSNAQQKGFSHFNWTSSGGLKIDKSGKLLQQTLSVIYIAESDFMFWWNLQVILTLKNHWLDQQKQDSDSNRLKD